MAALFADIWWLRSRAHTDTVDAETVYEFLELVCAHKGGMDSVKVGLIDHVRRCRCSELMRAIARALQRLTSSRQSRLWTCSRRPCSHFCANWCAAGTRWLWLSTGTLRTRTRHAEQGLGDGSLIELLPNTDARCTVRAANGAIEGMQGRDPVATAIKKIAKVCTPYPRRCAKVWCT